MTATPPGPGEPPWPDGMAGRRLSLTTLWALALGRFRDYLHWTAETADDPRHDQGEAHDPDR
jgi:hypothetical protein